MKYLMTFITILSLSLFFSPQKANALYMQQADMETARELCSFPAVRGNMTFDECVAAVFEDLIELGNGGPTPPPSRGPVVRGNDCEPTVDGGANCKSVDGSFPF